MTISEFLTFSASIEQSLMNSLECERGKGWKLEIKNQCGSASRSSTHTEYMYLGWRGERNRKEKRKVGKLNQL